MPDFNQKKETFMPKFQGLQRAIKHTIESKRRALREAGYIVPGETQLPKRQQSITTPQQQSMAKPANKQSFMDTLNKIKAEKGTEAAQAYYKQWVGQFDWENK